MVLSVIVFEITAIQVKNMFEGDTPLPPCVLRTAYFWPCVLRTAIFWPRLLRTVYQQKTTILGVSIYIKKIKLKYVACTCTIILESISFSIS